MAAKPSAMAGEKGERSADAAERPDKTPRTARGRATLRKLLDAAAIEFGERGFHEASISGITRRAGTALGSYYTYFDSKDEIFRALVQDMSAQVGKHAAAAMQEASGALDRERARSRAFWNSRANTRKSTGSSTRPSSSTPTAIARIIR